MTYRSVAVTQLLDTQLTRPHHIAATANSLKNTSHHWAFYLFGPHPNVPLEFYHFSTSQN